MEKFLRKGTMINLISSILFLIIGIILLTSPITTLNIITYVIELMLIVWGTITIINYVRVESKHDIFGCGFIQGVVCVLLALFLIVNSKIVVTILPICIGIWMLLGSISRIQIAIKLNAWGQKINWLHILLTALMFTVGLLIICNPFATAAVIVQMLGIGIIVYTIMDIIQSIGIIRFLNNLDV